ncbi:tyrosine-type recombinase/integrase [Desulfomonile tiedjei]|uniref:Site-specific recombinase XerD n=1 Tax=Desulfomonile tiedjei (strain ATCC 49306 / DSM 6799 / DCB-1) TaxID=706587 RepID=I4C2B8_DESTA|nr:site-specific integrase [Desulfomonile tiedjei]AFM23709.1 site-specific recombinase XerD [Desulfomonile tiedjei DSM 6799]
MKKFAGVYVTESAMRQWRERPDRCYSVMFRDLETGKLRFERCGWASEGWTPEAAQRRRTELLEQDRVGEYKSKAQRKQDELTFGRFMEDRFLPWSDDNTRHPRDYRGLYKNWLKPEFETKTLGGIDPLSIERLRKKMRDAGRSDARIIHALGLLRNALNKAIQWRLWSGENPIKAVRLPKLNNARQRFLSTDEAERLLTALRKKSKQIERMARMSLYGGFRLGELFKLTWGNVDLKNGIIMIQDTKNSESRPIFTTSKIRAVLDELTPGEPDELVFTTKQGRSIQWLSKTFGVVLQELGLNRNVTDRREKVCFHTLRHTFASWAVMAGIPIYTLAKTLGHRTTTMTVRYSHLSPDSQKTAFEAVSRFAEESKGTEAEAANNDG